MPTRTATATIGRTVRRRRRALGWLRTMPDYPRFDAVWDPAKRCTRRTLGRIPWRSGIGARRDGARGIGDPVRPRPRIQPRASDSGEFERQQTVARDDARPALQDGRGASFADAGFGVAIAKPVRGKE